MRKWVTNSTWHLGITIEFPGYGASSVQIISGYVKITGFIFLNDSFAYQSSFLASQLHQSLIDALMESKTDKFDWFFKSKNTLTAFLSEQ